MGRTRRIRSRCRKARGEEQGFTLLDTQWLTPHLVTFGAVEIPRLEYQKQLGRSIDRACLFVDGKIAS